MVVRRNSPLAGIDAPGAETRPAVPEHGCRPLPLVKVAPSAHRVSHRTIVIGAGLNGLSCAFHLKRAGREVLVLEASDRPGGVVGTLAFDGFRFETGPNTILGSSEELRNLAAELGILERLVATPPSARRRYLWHAGKLRALPSPLTALTSLLLSPSAKLRVASEYFRKWTPPPASAGEPSLRAFLTERLGDEATDRLAGAFVRGVYAADLDELGARSAFPRMWNACVHHGGLIRGLRAAAQVPKPILPGPQCRPSDLLSFQNGMQELVDALATSLGPNLRVATRVEAVQRAGARWAAVLAHGEALEADALVLAVPAPACASLLARADVGDEALAPLQRIAHARLVVVHLGLDARGHRPLPRGFGFLVPPDAPGAGSPQALGTIFASNLFAGRAPRGCIAVTSFFHADTVRGWPDTSIAELAARDLALAVDVPYPIATSRVLHWNDVIPRYAPNHDRHMTDLVQHLARRAPGLRLAGSFLGGVAVDRVLAQGRALAKSISGGGGAA